jgi:NAD(P)-dependent dehydrogenase (short-subunit alcohol dehydrogenase family)
MSSSLVLECGSKVRVKNTLSAGPFLTDIAKAWPEELRFTALGAQGRVAQTEEIASTALFLASPKCSFVTGALVRCDGV